jgi:hypothetical protein
MKERKKLFTIMVIDGSELYIDLDFYINFKKSLKKIVEKMNRINKLVILSITEIKISTLPTRIRRLVDLRND